MTDSRSNIDSNFKVSGSNRTRPGLNVIHRGWQLLAVAAATMLLYSAGPARDASAESSDLHAYVSKKAAVLSTIHRKAMRALVNAAQDRSFESYFRANDEQSRHAAKTRIEQVALATQNRFHVEEMCLIDADGPEIARIVGRTIAPESELSPDETGANFFAPGFAEEARRVHVSRPYVSPDAHKWVIAYVTPINVDGENKAVLHYEQGLEVYQAALRDHRVWDERFLLAVSADGYVVFDSRRPIAVDGRDGLEDAASYFEHIDDVAPTGFGPVFGSLGEQKTGNVRLTDGGVDYDVAFAAVEGDMVLMAAQRR